MSNDNDFGLTDEEFKKLSNPSADLKSKKNPVIVVDKTEFESLKGKFPAIDIEKIINNLCEKWNQHPFKEATKDIFLPQIKKSITLINRDAKIEDIQSKLKQKEEKKLSEFKIANKEEKEEKKVKEEKGFLIWVEKFNSYVVDIQAVADYFCSNYNFLTVKAEAKEKDELKRWNGRTWEDDAKSFIKEKCETLLGKYAKINPINEIIAKIERKNYIEREDFENLDINLIPLENGVYHLLEKKLKEYIPQYYFKTIIPINYDESSKCPLFLKFLEEALYPEDLPVVQEWFGFQLYRRYLIKKGVICLGERNTGKTVFLDTLIEFVGERNKTGLSLQKISSGSDFNKLSLKDKYSNVYDDLSSRDLSDGGNFKVATGGGYISGEEKFGGYKQFKNYAKHTFATNKIPPVKDNDDMAYFSRWIVLRFDNPVEKKDLFLRDKIKKEKSGILNWALEGLFRLLKNGEFSYRKSPEEVKQIMEMSGDPLIQFGDEVLENSDNRVSKEQMYEVYSIWANEKNKPLLSKEQLGRRLNSKVKYLVAKTGAKERFWDNVSIKKEWSEKLKKTNNLQKELILDTLDTSKKNMRKSPEVYKDSYNITKNIYDPISTSGGYDIIKNKVSNPSNEKELIKTDQEKDNTIDFSELDKEFEGGSENE